MVKLQNIDQEEKLQSKGDKRESQDDSRRMRRQYDEDTSSSTTDTRLHKSNTNGAERLARQNGDDNVQRNVDTSGMVDDQIDHQQITTSCTTDDCPLPNNILLLKPTDSNNSYALTDETYKEAEIQKQMVRKYFETIDYKGLTTVHKNLFCNDNLYQSLYVYPVQGELNDTPRAIPIDHPGDNTYLSASGNQVCHPEEEQVSNRHTIHTDVQANNALAEARQLNGPRPIPGIHGRWHRNSFENTHNN